MAKVYDIPATDLIVKLAERLKMDKKIEPPFWSAYVKTGSHVEKIPQNRDWWYIRCASIVRKVYLHGPIGTSDLRSMYGGEKELVTTSTIIVMLVVRLLERRYNS